MKWVKVEFWTPEETREVVAQITDLEDDVLSKEDSDFVKLRFVRWIELVELDDEFEEDQIDIEDLSEEARAEFKRLAEEIDEDDEEFDEEEIEELEDEEELEEVIMRLEDDLDFGGGDTMYVRREHIVSVVPLQEEYEEYWNATLDEEDEQED
ncbi:MAG: hypothetical protein U5N86_12810 [Planctomycetota bacterium]|nr:hypothetical protein [Planctomycetota bacterium]